MTSYEEPTLSGLVHQLLLSSMKFLKNRTRTLGLWMVVVILPSVLIFASLPPSTAVSLSPTAAVSSTPVALTPWSKDPHLYATVGANDTAVHAWGMRTTPDAWGTGPMNYASGVTTTNQGLSPGSVSFNLSGTYCPGGVCSFGAGTGYKAFVQIWNNPTNYIAFGLIHDPAVSPNGMTIMVEGAANGRPVGGYWAPGAVTGTFHHITVTWGAQGVRFTLDAVTLGWYPLTITYPSISFMSAARISGDIVDATFTSISFAESFTVPNSTVTGKPLYLPPNNPPANILPNPNYSGCSEKSCIFPGPPCYDNWPPYYSEFFSLGCINDQVIAIDNARTSENVAPMMLPSNWTSLSLDEQIFVVINLERVARGLPPFVGLNASLDQIAQQGADPPNLPMGWWGDPELPSNFSFGGSTQLAWNCITQQNGGANCPGPGNPGASIAIGGALGPLDADYEWMYNDGWGSANVDCTSSMAPGCWGHRDNILGPYPVITQYASSTFGEGPTMLPSPEPTTLVMGTGAFTLSPSGPPPGWWGVMNMTAIFVAVTGPPPPFIYTWSQAVAAGAGTA